MLYKIFLFLMFFSFTAGCTSLNLTEKKEQPYDRERICTETERELAFVSTSKRRRKQLSNVEYRQLVDRYVLNGCDK